MSPQRKEAAQRAAFFEVREATVLNGPFLDLRSLLSIHVTD